MSARDFRSGQQFNHAAFFGENVDIHHIFPKAWCEAKGIKSEVYDSIINKTPLSARTNRILGGVAPSAYLARLEKGGDKNPAIEPARLDSILSSHEIDPASLRADSFDAAFDDRRERLLALIEAAMGKSAVREDIAPPDPDDYFSEEEAESDMADLAADAAEAGAIG